MNEIIEEKLLKLEKSLKEVKEQLDDLDYEISSVRNDIPNLPDEFVDTACRGEVGILYDGQRSHAITLQKICDVLEYNGIIEEGDI